MGDSHQLTLPVSGVSLWQGRGAAAGEGMKGTSKSSLEKMYLEVVILVQKVLGKIYFERVTKTDTELFHPLVLQDGYHGQC